MVLWFIYTPYYFYTFSTMGCGSSSDKGNSQQTVSLTPGQPQAEICKSFPSSRFVVSPRVAPPVIKQWSSSGSIHTTNSVEAAVKKHSVSNGDTDHGHLSRSASPNGKLASPAPSRATTPTLIPATLEPTRSRTPSPRFSPKVTPRKEPQLSKD